MAQGATVQAKTNRVTLIIRILNGPLAYTGTRETFLSLSHKRDRERERGERERERERERDWERETEKPLGASAFPVVRFIPTVLFFSTLRESFFDSSLFLSLARGTAAEYKRFRLQYRALSRPIRSRAPSGCAVWLPSPTLLYCLYTPTGVRMYVCEWKRERERERESRERGYGYSGRRARADSRIFQRAAIPQF